MKYKNNTSMILYIPYRRIFTILSFILVGSIGIHKVVAQPLLQTNDIPVDRNNITNPDFFPGYTDPTNGQNSGTCYSYMGAIDFVSDYLYTTNVGIETGYGDYRKNIYGFSIPLVADLNGDGKPEIITNSARYTYLSARYNGIHILNAQTGNLISSLNFKNNANTAYRREAGYHQSPSFMALAKIPHADGTPKSNVTVIFALPSYRDWSSSPYHQPCRLVAYEIIPEANGTYTWIV